MRKIFYTHTSVVPLYSRTPVAVEQLQVVVIPQPPVPVAVEQLQEVPQLAAELLHHQKFQPVLDQLSNFNLASLNVTTHLNSVLKTGLHTTSASPDGLVVKALKNIPSHLIDDVVIFTKHINETCVATFGPIRFVKSSTNVIQELQSNPLTNRWSSEAFELLNQVPTLNDKTIIVFDKLVRLISSEVLPESTAGLYSLVVSFDVAPFLTGVVVDHYVVGFLGVTFFFENYELIHHFSKEIFGKVFELHSSTNKIPINQVSFTSKQLLRSLYLASPAVVSASAGFTQHLVVSSGKVIADSLQQALNATPNREGPIHIVEYTLNYFLVAGQNFLATLKIKP